MSDENISKVVITTKFKSKHSNPEDKFPFVITTLPSSIFWFKFSIYLCGISLSPNKDTKLKWADAELNILYSFL